MTDRKGTLIWQSAKIDWQYETFKNNKTFEVEPHFKITATDTDGSSITWPHVQIDTDGLDNSIKGITDFTKWPLEVRDKVLDNCVIKLREAEPEITRITPHAS